MTKKEKEREAQRIISSEINFVKSKLLSLSSRLAELKPGKAKSLDTIIGRLEDWQHKR